uniref:Uncharacterized protein n=1 Tax=Lygus hesperus TaxID=30085 RepID=A0A0A9YXI1_LYGHE
MLVEIETAAEMRMVYDALSLGSTCLRALQDDIDVDDIELLMQDTQEAVQLSNTISNRLAQTDDSTALSLAALTDDQILQEFQSVFGAVPATTSSSAQSVATAPTDVKETATLPYVRVVCLCAAALSASFHRCVLSSISNSSPYVMSTYRTPPPLHLAHTD